MTQEILDRLKHTRLATGLLIYIAAVILLYTVLALVTPPIMGTDPAWGFGVFESMQDGSPFNHMLYPDPADISRDLTRFVAWWSPAQYLVPSAFTALGLSLGKALVVTTLVFSILGLAGYYRLYTFLGFPHTLAILCCAVIVSTRLFAISYYHYIGGSLLLFGATPWIMLLIFRWARMRPWQMAALVPVLLLGAFLKLSFVVIAIATLAALGVMRLLDREGAGLRPLVVYGLRIAAVFAVFYAILHLSFLARGETPVSQSGGIISPVTSLLTAFDGPIFSTFSIGEFLKRLIQLTQRGSTGTLSPFVFLVPFAISTAYVCIKALRIPAERLYGSLVIAFMATFTLVYAYFFSVGSDIGNRDRQFLAAGLLLLPGMLTVLHTHSHKAIKWAGYLLIAFFCVYGVGSFFIWQDVIKTHDTRSTRGFSHRYITAPAVGFLAEVDRELPAGNNLIIVGSPEVMLEVRVSRVYTINFMSADPDAASRHRGRVDNLLVHMGPGVVGSGAAERTLRSFYDYVWADWERVRVGEEYFYFQGRDEGLIRKIAERY